MLLKYMATRAPFTICQLSAVRIFFICLVSAVTAYTDLRNQSCMSPSTQYLLPGGRARWSGVIQVSLTCHLGYDQPLNSPPMGIFTCRPDGGPWDPDYIPDCNPIIRPENISINLTLDVSKTCATLGAATLSENKKTITFSEGKSINISNSCKLLQSKKDCTFTKVTMPCKEPDFKLRVTLTLAYTDLVNAVLVANGTDGLLEDVAEQLQIPASSSGNGATAEGEGCSTGTAGAFDKTLGAVCRGCSLGHYLSTVGRTCLPCPPGYFADSPMSERCLVCPGMPKEEDLEAWQQIKEKAAERGTDISTCPMPIMRPSKMANSTIAVGQAMNGGCWMEAKVTLTLTLGCLLSVIISHVNEHIQA